MAGRVLVPVLHSWWTRFPDAALDLREYPSVDQMLDLILVGPRGRQACRAPGITIRSLDPPRFRDVVAVLAAPHDELLRRFVSDLRLVSAASHQRR